MNEVKTSHHWLEIYDRSGGLEKLFIGFNNALSYYKKRMDEESWYDVGFYWDDTDLIYGVMFVSLQNYINQCCYDFLDANLFGCKGKYEYYSKNSAVIEGSNVTQIQLIIDLTNYFEHRDDPPQKDRNQNKKNDEDKRRERFWQIGLNYPMKETYERFEDRLLIDGLEKLSENMEISVLLQIAKDWRKDLWSEWHKSN
ncbi:MAG: hypothetical protein Q8P34_01155 [Bacteroidota bacterium]|nr:hypothetical protein [Bacteroidota bacterium]